METMLSTSTVVVVVVVVVISFTLTSPLSWTSELRIQV
jgi:hypothetical protein